MAQAIGDPEELERFAQALNSFLDSLKESVNSLNYSFSSLGDTWRDEKRTQFEAEYEALIQQLSAFEANAVDQIPYLMTLASRLRDYLQS